MRVLSAVHPSNTQKQVLAKIVASPTPKVAAEEISKDQNSVAARNMLMRLELITFSDRGAELTDKGMQVAADEGIIDQTGQLTDQGQQLAYADSPQQDPAQPPMESSRYSDLLKQLLS